MAPAREVVGRLLDRTPSRPRGGRRLGRGEGLVEADPGRGERRRSPAGGPRPPGRRWPTCSPFCWPDSLTSPIRSHSPHRRVTATRMGEVRSFPGRAPMAVWGMPRRSLGALAALTASLSPLLATSPPAWGATQTEAGAGHRGQGLRPRRRDAAGRRLRHGVSRVLGRRHPQPLLPGDGDRPAQPPPCGWASWSRRAPVVVVLPGGGEVRDAPSGAQSAGFPVTREPRGQRLPLLRRVEVQGHAAGRRQHQPPRPAAHRTSADGAAAHGHHRPAHDDRPRTCSTR